MLRRAHGSGADRDVRAEPDVTAVREIDWPRAACWGSGQPNLWFPSESGANPNTAVAKRICEGCPILDDCREYALADERLVGVWVA